MRILSSFRATAQLPLVFSLNLLAIMTALVSLGPPLLAQSDEQRRDFERDDQGGQLRRDQWFYRQRAFPYDKIPSGVRFAAWNERRALEAKAHARALANGLGEPAWTFIGPEDNQFWGGSSGRITALAVDPRNSQVVWAGAADGGVWKTTDGGVHWVPVADGQPSLSIGALTLDPSNPDTVFVGTGEGNFSGDEYGGIGILKSTDGGATWTTLTAAFSSGSTITQIAVSPTSSQIVLVANSSGIFRSADGGNTWRNVLPGYGTAVAFNPANPSIAWAAFGYLYGDPRNGVYGSVDGGQTWKRVTGTNPNLLPPAAQIGRVSLAVAPTNPSLIYAGIAPILDDTTSLGGLYASSDGGSNWTLVSQACYGADWYRDAFAVSPANPSLLIGGGLDAWVSTDGGQTWLEEIQPLHPDQHAVAFSKDGSIVYLGGDGGVYSSTDAGSAATQWTNLNATLGVTQFYPGMALHPTNPSITIGGTQDNGTLIYNGSLTWGWLQCGDGGAAAIDPVTPANIYISCVPNSVPSVVKSIDGGRTFVEAAEGIDASEGSPWPPVIVMDPSNSSTLYFAGNLHLYQTTDAAATWNVISPDLTDGEGAYAPLAAIAVAPSDPNTVYVGTAGGLLQATHNALSGSSATWTNLLSSVLPLRSITAIAIDHANPNRVFVAFSGFSSGLTPKQHVFVTTDGGNSWKNISGNLPNSPVNDLALDPIFGVIYAGTDTGVFESSDSGASWQPLGVGLPNAVVVSVKLYNSGAQSRGPAGTRFLRVATHGRGMWDLPLSSLRPLAPHRAAE